MNLFETIYRRKSIRKYAGKSLPAEKLQEIKAIADGASKLYANIDMRVHIVEDGEKIQEIMSGIIGSYGKVRAPHYLVITSEEKDGYLENVGFAVEEIVLKLTALGIGTCWIGGHVKKNLLQNIINLPEAHTPAVLVSFGYPAEGEELLRKNPAEAKRLAVSEFVTGTPDATWSKIMDAVRIAPSAANTQPWRIAFEGGAVHVFAVKRSFFLVKHLLERVNRIDIGIALSHIAIAAEHFGKKLEFKKLKSAETKEHDYVLSVVEKK